MADRLLQPFLQDRPFRNGMVATSSVVAKQALRRYTSVRTLPPTPTPVTPTIQPSTNSQPPSISYYHIRIVRADQNQRKEFSHFQPISPN